MAAQRSSDSGIDGRRPAVRLVIYLALGLVPWTIVVAPGGTSVFFAFGLADPASGHLVSTTSYVFTHTRGLPPSLLAWPIGVGLYLLAVGSVVVGTVTGREDRRLTGGLVVLVGLTQVQFVVGVSARPGYLAVPIGALVAFLIAWRIEWAAVRGQVLPASG